MSSRFLVGALPEGVHLTVDLSGWDNHAGPKAAPTQQLRLDSPVESLALQELVASVNTEPRSFCNPCGRKRPSTSFARGRLGARAGGITRLRPG